MGWRWEVEAWLKTATNTANDAGYEYVTMYQGYSLLGVWRASIRVYRWRSWRGCRGVPWVRLRHVCNCWGLVHKDTIGWRAKWTNFVYKTRLRPKLAGKGGHAIDLCDVLRGMGWLEDSYRFMLPDWLANMPVHTGKLQSAQSTNKHVRETERLVRGPDRSLHQLRFEGHAVISRRRRIVARVDRADWREVLARDHAPWSPNGEGMRWAMTPGMADFYRRSHLCKDRMVTALAVAGKVATRKGVHRLVTDDEPVPQRPVRHTLAEEMQRAQRAHELRTIGKRAALELPLPALVAANNIMNESAPEMKVWVDECTEDQKENDMDLSKLTPDQMLEKAAQMQKMAESKKRELAPELLRQLLESGQSELAAAALLAETTERFRRAMNAVREARGLPTTKKA